MKFGGLIPVMTTSAGACLTAANWQEAHVKIASYDLSALLVKPGYSLLNALTDLATYVGWPNTIVLNAARLEIDETGVCTLRSSYDGSYIRHTIHEILALMAQLKPDMVLLPKGVMRKNHDVLEILPESIFPFFSVNDLPASGVTRPYGVYWLYEQSLDWLDELELYHNRYCYVVGDLNLKLMLELHQKGVHYLESDIPASQAYHGQVYHREGMISLSAYETSTSFEVIDKTCDCPTCRRGLSQAYLRHLLAKTPWLCQRFLIQHNIAFCQSVCFRSPTLFT